MICTDKTMVVLAFIDSGVECKINDTGIGNVVQGVPRHIGVREVGIQVDMGDAAAGALGIQYGSYTQFFLNRALGG